MAAEKPRSVAAATGGQAPADPKIRWDDTKMQNGYANVCNMASTREVVVLLFGITQA